MDDDTRGGRRALWWSSAVALAIAALWIWHALLFKLTVHTPLRLAAAVAVGWVLVALGLAIERRSRPGDGVPHVWRRLAPEGWTVLVGASALLLVFDIGFMRAASDGRGYFAQLHSIVFDLDLDFANDIEAFAARPEDANLPFGTALLWLPFYLLAHAWLGLVNLMGGDVPRDGFFNPYQRAVGLGTLVYGTAAMLLVAASLRRRFDLGTTNLAALLTLLATPVVWYLTVGASMSHGPSLFAATAFLALWLESMGQRTRAQWLGLIALAALMVLVRPQNAVFITVLGVEMFANLYTAWRAGNPDAARRQLLALAALAVVGGVSAVLLLALTGITPDYVLRERLFSDFNIGLQLFSPNHGLVSNSPVLLFALVGLVPLARRHARLAAAFGLVVALQVLVGGTSVGWNAGSSFGARRFVACALPFAFGLAAVVDLARRRPLVPLALAASAFVGLNLLLVDEARRGTLTLSEPVPFERMSWAVTSRIGNPFALPGALAFSWRHQIPLSMYDRIPGRKYRNLGIDIGAPGDDLYLFGGWFAPEQSAAGPFRWAGGSEAVVFTQVRGERYRLSVVAQPFSWPGAPLQTLHVYLGEELLADVVMAPETLRYEIDITEARFPRHDWLRIGFRFERSTAPRDVMDSDDARLLAVRFERIELEAY